MNLPMIILLGKQPFYDEGDKKGLVWDADMDNQVVRCVSCNVDLLKKYNSIDTA